MGESAPPAGRLRRWRWWIAALALLILGRVSLPEIVRRVAISQAEANLRARVELGNVDFHLWRGGVVLEDFALRPLPPATQAMPGEQQGEAPEPPPLPAIVAFERLALGLRFRPLFDKTLQLYELVLQKPHVALDRLEDGSLNLMHVLPPQEPTETETAEPPPQEASGWRFGLDRLALLEGGVTFHDLMMRDSEPVDVAIPTIEVRDIALDPQVYGQPSDFRVNVLLDDGSLDLAARLQMAADGSAALESELEARNLPLRRARVYVPEVGWSDLRGQLDASLAYRLETGTSNELRGTVTLREVSVAVPELPHAALSWRSVSVRVDPVDLEAQSVHLAEVTLDGVLLAVEPKAPGELPVMARQATPSETPGEEEAVTAEPLPPPAAGVEPARPWRWSLGVLRLRDSLLRLAGEPPQDVGLALELEGFSDALARPGRVDLRVGAAGGTVHLSGATRIEPPGFAGELEIAELSVPDLIAASQALPDSPVASAVLATKLAIEAGMSTSESSSGASDLRVRGTLHLDDLALTPPGMKDLGIRVRALDLALEPLFLAGVLAPPAEGVAARGDLDWKGELRLTAPTVQLADGRELGLAAEQIRVAMERLSLPGIAGGDPTGKPKVVALGELRLDRPTVRLTRTVDGLVLPGAAPAANAPAAAPAAAPSEPARGGAAPEPAVSASAGEAAPLDLRIAGVRIEKGQIDILDRAVKPEFRGRLSELVLQASDVRWPRLSARNVKLSMRTPGNGEIALRGDIAADAGTLDLDLTKVDLPSFNPYAATYSPFRLSGGALSLATEVAYRGEEWKVGNDITLHQLALAGGEGESLFQKEFGIPLATALALLQDGKGDIAMDIPVEIDREGAKVDVIAIAGAALRRALLNALASPLRMLGAATGMGDKVESLAPAAIDFRRGLAQPAAGAEGRLEQLGAFLATRPALAVALETAVTQADARWLREQRLRAQWQEEGLIAQLLSLGQRGAKGRIQDALAARAAGEQGELSAEDSQLLDEWLAEVPPPTAEELAALGAARLAYAERVLRAQPGVAAERIRSEAVPSELGEGAPEVRIALGAAQP